MHVIACCKFSTEKLITVLFVVLTVSNHFFADAGIFKPIMK